MKTKQFMLVLLMAVFASSMFAQPKTCTLTPEQKVEIEKVREAYAPKFQEIKQEMRVLGAEQKALLSSKVIDEQKVYKNLDKMSELKVAMQKQMLSMHKEKVAIAPEAGKKKGHGMKPKQCASKQGKGKSCDKAVKGQGKGKGQGKACTSATCAQGPKAKQGKHSRQGAKKGQQSKRQGAKGMNFTDEQKEAMKAVKMASFWEIQDTKNAISVLKANNVTVDDKLKSLNKLGDLQAQLAKQKMAVKLQMIDLMTEEQRMKAVAMHNQPRSQKGKQHRR